MAYPPQSYPPSASLSRSRAGEEDSPSMAQAMLAHRPSSTVSSAHTLLGYPTPPPSYTKGVAQVEESSQQRSATRLRSSISPSLASTEALRRIRDVEEENRTLRELANRLRAEGAAATGLSPSQIRQLQNDARASSVDTPKRAHSGLFKKVCSTDLLFLIDTTGSMSAYIDAAKEQVKSIVNDINSAFLEEAEVRIAVVGYKDHRDCPNIEFLDFTTAVHQVRGFIDGLYATGGDDTPEDVLGGIKQALNATWKHQTRCIIHIADAPPHGRILHDLGDSRDEYANPGSEPHGLTYEPLLERMVKLNINYALLSITGDTDRMAFKFLKVYLDASAECKLRKSNKYYAKARGLAEGAGGRYRGSSNSWRNSKAKLQFEEMELGTTYKALRHMVVKNVTSSASRTAFRMTASAPPKTNRWSEMLSQRMGSIREDEDDVIEVKLETGPPRWNTPGWLNETLMLEGFSSDVGVHGASTLNDMMAHDDNIKMSITELTINKRSKPFAQGAMRVASYARTTASTNRLIVKSFKKDGKRLAHLVEDMRCQALCKAFALEFNALLGEQFSLDFIVTACLRSKRRGGLHEKHLSLERYIEGTYVKYNSNTNWVNKDLRSDPFNQAAQAFSHFTFERSQGRFLVCDLQGVGHLLTDPAIHTRDAERFKLSDTNLGEDGFKFFFSSHKCNDICSKLRLKSNRSMFVSGKFEYRDTWPLMDNVACCSNQLCGKILHLASSKKSDDFPDHHWCDECWPQLHSTIVSLLCVAPGPQHEFQASRFFYESQGRSLPRFCADHHREDTTLSRPEFNVASVISAQPRSMLRMSSEWRGEPTSVSRTRSELSEASYYTPSLSTYDDEPALFEPTFLPYRPFGPDSSAATRKRSEMKYKDPFASETSVASGRSGSKIKSSSKTKSTASKAESTSSKAKSTSSKAKSTSTKTRSISSKTSHSHLMKWP